MHRPRKRFGQNFLQNQSIINDILRAFHPQPTDQVVEIGPGLGALTAPLLQHLNTLTAIEIDTDLIGQLKELPEASKKLNLLSSDALTIDYSQFGTHLRIIGNLPYNISTPLVIHLLKYASHLDDMHFMLQKEVVDRLSAPPGGKTYGRLSIMVQYHCMVEPLFIVPATAFYPKPKVESAIVRLTPYISCPYPSVSATTLESLLASAFSMRRKTIANNLKSILHSNDLISLGIDPSLRPEQLNINDYVQLAKFISN